MKRHNVFTEETIKFTLSSNDDKNVINWFSRNACIRNEHVTLNFFFQLRKKKLSVTI